MATDASQIVINVSTLLWAAGGFGTILYLAGSLILSLFNRNLKQERAHMESQITSVLEAITELKNGNEALRGRVANISEGLAVARDRLNRQ